MQKIMRCHHFSVLHICLLSVVALLGAEHACIVQPFSLQLCTLLGQCSSRYLQQRLVKSTDTGGEERSRYSYRGFTISIVRYLNQVPYFALFTYCTLCRTGNRHLIFLGLCSVEEADPKLVQTHFVFILFFRLSYH